MFTLLPSLYLVAAHYIRRWSTSCSNEEERTIFDTSHINEKHLITTINDIQSIDLIEKCDNTLLQYNKELLTSSKQISNHLDVTEINKYVNHDENNQYNEIDSNIEKLNQFSSLLNTERCKTYNGELDENTMTYLTNETGFTPEQILTWHNDFLHDCPDGKLSKSKFIDIYKQFYKKGRVVKFCEHAFRVFDKDGSGYIDFVEFLIAVSMTSTKDPIKKTDLFFSMYDIDRNGLIDENEMRCVVESIYELMGIDINDSTRIDMKVREIFAKAECDQSGYLRKDQFALACKNDRYIRKLLVPNTKVPKNQ